MSKLTVDDIVPGELYVFTDANPIFSSWIGLVARAVRRSGLSNKVYEFEIIDLADGARSLGYEVGAQLTLKINFFERYPCVQSASDQLFS
jgi:hypothetical protein